MKLQKKISFCLLFLVCIITLLLLDINISTGLQNLGYIIVGLILSMTINYINLIKHEKFKCYKLRLLAYHKNVLIKYVNRLLLLKYNLFENDNKDDGKIITISKFDNIDINACLFNIHSIVNDIIPETTEQYTILRLINLNTDVYYAKDRHQLYNCTLNAGLNISSSNENVSIPISQINALQHIIDCINLSSFNLIDYYNSKSFKSEDPLTFKINDRMFACVLPI